MSGVCLCAINGRTTPRARLRRLTRHPSTFQHLTTTPQLTLEQHAEDGGSILESPPQTPVGGAHPPAAASLPLPAAAVAESALQQQLRAQGATVATSAAATAQGKAASAAPAPAPAEGASSADVDAEECN